MILSPSHPLDNFEHTLKMTLFVFTIAVCLMTPTLGTGKEAKRKFEELEFEEQIDVCLKKLKSMQRANRYTGEEKNRADEFEDMIKSLQWQWQNHKRCLKSYDDDLRDGKMSRREYDLNYPVRQSKSKQVNEIEAGIKCELRTRMNKWQCQLYDHVKEHTLRGSDLERQHKTAFEKVKKYKNIISKLDAEDLSTKKTNHKIKKSPGSVRQKRGRSSETQGYQCREI